MKELKLTPQQIKDNQKSELIDDLVATSTVIDEVWRYHPENPNKMDVVKEYNILKKIQKDIELELEGLED
jgi:anion-transporting  ArsA/GET3 family ATPase